ncbi:MAG: TolC family protein [Verrucomicrobia bacterium]|nr:TolC family protein [Verrucomicrobiota bacterium]
MLKRRNFLSYLSLLGVLTGPALQATAPLTLSEALAIALQKNPTLQVHKFGARMAEARILQAGIKPNPNLSVEFENFLGTGDLSGVKSLETTLQLSQVIDLAGSRAKRVETAKASLDVADADYENQRIEVFSQVARRFTESEAAEHRLETARSARELSEKIVDSVRARVEADQTTPIELNKARVALALSQVDEEHAEHELAAKRQSLAAALGEVEPNFGEISGDLMTLPTVPDYSSLFERLEKSPVLSRYTVEARWREAQIRLEQSLRRSRPLLSGGLRRVEATDDFSLVARVSLPFQVHDQTQGKVLESRERRARVDALFKATRLEMISTLFAVYQEMIHVRTVFTQLRGEIIPLAEEIYELTEQGYLKGRYSLLEMQDAQRSLIELRKQIVGNAEAFHIYVIEIERLLGTPLMGDIPRN